WITNSLVGAVIAMAAVACTAEVRVGTYAQGGEGAASGMSMPGMSVSTGMSGCAADPAKPVACSADTDCAPLGATAVCYGGWWGCGSGRPPPPPQDDVILYGSDPVTLRMTSFPLTCADPKQDPPYNQCNWYTIEVTFPAALLKPGPLPKNDD